MKLRTFKHALLFLPAIVLVASLGLSARLIWHTTPQHARAQMLRPHSGGGPIVFIHIATPSNITANWTDIDNPATNNNPHAILEVTPNWNPHHIYDNSPIGVWFHDGKWAIFNQNQQAMPNQAAFNVEVLFENPMVFILVATPSNTRNGRVIIDNPLINLNTDVILQVTPNLNPGGTGGVYDNHLIGVGFDEFHWYVFNQNLAAMPIGAAFNVQVFIRPIWESGLTLNSGPAFVHKRTSMNTAFDHTDIDNPMTNLYPEAIVFVTESDFNGLGDFCSGHNHQIGVWYQNNQWSILNEDRSNFDDSPCFNVYVPPPQQPDLVPIKFASRDILLTSSPSYCFTYISQITGRIHLLVRVQNLGLTSPGAFDTALAYRTPTGVITLTQRASPADLPFVDLDFDVTNAFIPVLVAIVTVDVNGEVAEANENNNSVTLICERPV